MASDPLNPLRGEVWRVDLNPTRGSEIRKARPVVVISSDGLRSLPIRLVAPLTGWRPEFSNRPSHVLIEPNQANGLVKRSAVDALQLRGLDVQRFETKLGILTEDELANMTLAIAAVIELEI